MRRHRVHQSLAAHLCRTSEGSLLLPRHWICSSDTSLEYCVGLCSGLLFSGAVLLIHTYGLSKFKQPLVSNPQMNDERGVFWVFLIFFCLFCFFCGFLEVQVVLASDSWFHWCYDIYAEKSCFRPCLWLCQDLLLRAGETPPKWSFLLTAPADGV